MNAERFAQRIRPRVERELREGSVDGDYANEDAFQAAVDSAVQEEAAQAERDAAQEAELYGDREDSPSIQSADIYGTGEGRFHGLI